MLKLAVAVATEDAMPDAFVVWRGIENSIRKAADFGYDGIELALKTAGQADVPAIQKLCDETGMSVPCISTGQVFAGLGLYFTHPEKDKREEVKKVFKDIIDVASEFGAMVNIGRSRGFVEKGEDLRDAEKRFIETARDIASYAQEKDIKLILEPVNRYEINFIDSVPQGAELMKKVNVPNMGLMPDLFHMNIEDITLGGELEQYKEHVSYIHFADSNRLAPGQGHTDFDKVLESLKNMEYNGWISIEILPKPTPDIAAKQAVEFLRPKIDRFNKT